jgi:superfamily II DNA/RNA helicase
MQRFLDEIDVIHGQLLVTGGRPVHEDLDEWKRKGANILIGTPGKLEDLLKYNAFNFKELEILVLDEADR